jgi:hypothetical protein
MPPTENDGVIATTLQTRVENVVEYDPGSDILDKHSVVSHATAAKHREKRSNTGGS